jgi:hypothetical protein
MCFWARRRKGAGRGESAASQLGRGLASSSGGAWHLHLVLQSRPPSSFSAPLATAAPVVGLLHAARASRARRRPSPRRSRLCCSAPALLCARTARARARARARTAAPSSHEALAVGGEREVVIGGEREEAIGEERSTRHRRKAARVSPWGGLLIS